ncbi:hypothetical protein VA7868_03367 [Vibrio aerogenes CECT 7868]|uniref:Zinc carboxypeptidase n=1 Tax=Vibrio aerogenes CECT 7868 TaxID=1216006 RepID=A0A1M5ZX98_9VIBR|nr:hypothetical protein [Vibrio aerogenes]SHI28776.1 hypothetical protein VA7868_03367 [Vibrio aerogenes CECT 7868]
MISPYHLMQVPGHRPEKTTEGTRHDETGETNYQTDVVKRIMHLENNFIISRYGVLSCDPERYPLYYLKNKNWHDKHPVILLTGGVHGQDCSSISGLLRFLETEASSYTKYFNLLCVPCVSPRSYESSNIQDPHTYDPDCHFYSASPCEESSHLIRLIAAYSSKVIAHFDLQETTPEPDDSAQQTHHIRSTRRAFSLVTDTENPQYPFQKAIMSAAEQVLKTEFGEDGDMKGGVSHIAMKALRRCNGLTNCYFRTTTRVCPDELTREQCDDVQVAAITGGLTFILNHRQ